MAGPARAIDLKLRLALRVAALAAICFLAVAAYALFDSDRAARVRGSRIAETVARDISLQLSQAHGFLSPRSNPDLQRVASPLMEPGLCIAYQDKVGGFRQGICSGALAERNCRAAKVTRRCIAPSSIPANRSRGRCWLTARRRAWRSRRSTPPPDRPELARGEPPVYHGVRPGRALPRGLCRARAALRPTHVIHAGLKQLAANDLSTRLPSFDLAELSAISERLQHACAKTGGHPRRTQRVDPELSLCKTTAAPSCARIARRIRSVAHRHRGAGRLRAHTAERECPPLLEECRGISRTTAGLMATLRGALVRLRPPDIEELGLALSLESLVASWNGLRRAA